MLSSTLFSFGGNKTQHLLCKHYTVIQTSYSFMWLLRHCLTLQLLMSIIFSIISDLILVGTPLGPFILWFPRHEWLNLCLLSEASYPVKISRRSQDLSPSSSHSVQSRPFQIFQTTLQKYLKWTKLKETEYWRKLVSFSRFAKKLLRSCQVLNVVTTTPASMRASSTCRTS